MFDADHLGALGRLSDLLLSYHAFAWEDWKPDGPGHMRLGGRRLTNVVYERLKGRAPTKAPADPRPKLQAKLDTLTRRT